MFFATMRSPFVGRLLDSRIKTIRSDQADLSHGLNPSEPRQAISLLPNHPTGSSPVDRVGSVTALRPIPRVLARCSGQRRFNFGGGQEAVHEARGEVAAIEVRV